jgi:hypothetical protein
MALINIIRMKSSITLIKSYVICKANLKKIKLQYESVIGNNFNFAKKNAMRYKLSLFKVRFNFQKSTTCYNNYKSKLDIIVTV